MAIIIDFSQAVLASIHSLLNTDSNFELSEDVVRRCVLSQIRNIRAKLRGEYGPSTVLAIDTKRSWRKDVFPYYKAGRKKYRDESPIDWPALYAHMDTVIGEIKQVLPYHTIMVEGAEADDVIAVAVRHFLQRGERVVIASGDKDFKQIHQSGVTQWDFVKAQWIVENDPQSYLVDHILKGDSIDGIPNVLSADDCFVNKIRQGKLTAKRLDELRSLNMFGADLPLCKKYPDILRNYERNKLLIDLSQQPPTIVESIEQLLQQAPPERNSNTLLNYFIRHRLRHLTESLNDF